MKKNLVLSLCVFLVLAVVAAGCGGQQKEQPKKAAFPEKPIEMVVPFAAGGGTDAVARALADAAKQYLGQSVVIVNKTGGGGAVGMTEGSKAKADGYTVTMLTREIVSLPQMGLAPISHKNFDLIANINQDPAVVVVKKDAKWKDLKEFIADAKQKSLKFGSTANPNFYALAFELNQKIKFNHIPFNGASEALQALLGNHVDFVMCNPGEAVTFVNAGTLRLLGVMSDQRDPAFKDVPTFKEMGADVTSGTWRGLAVPKGTPKEVADKLAQAFEKAAKDPKFVEFMQKRNLGIYYLDAAKFQTFIENDEKVMKEIADYLKTQKK